MDRHISQYFNSSPEDHTRGHFHRVIALHDAPDLEDEAIWELCPDLPRGWFEVVQLSVADRLDFVQGYWMQKLPFLPHMKEAITTFFARLDDICVYLVQPNFEDPFHAEMVYSLKDNAGFYRGRAPFSEEQLQEFSSCFSEQLLPADYLAFLQVHGGFSKLMDSGVLSPLLIKGACQRVKTLIEAHPTPLVDKEQQLIDPSSLIPFYESFSLPAYQCFWSEWYPQDEMGNVYFSGLESSLSDISRPGLWTENMAFPTFLDWLAFYLEAIE